MDNEDFDFLPSPETNPQISEGSGGSFGVGKNIFTDKYKNHLDAHKVFSVPPLRSEFNLQANFDVAANSFSDIVVKSRVRTNFFGNNTDYNQLLQGYTLFQNPSFLNSTLNQLQAQIPADLFSGIEKPKMKINDRFGMFSFDLASMAMTYVFEYFDKKGNLVDSNYVEKRNEKFYFKNEVVEQKIKKRENGSPYVVSSVRNCLIDFEKVAKQERSVEIFVLNSFGGGEETDKLIYNSMSAICVAQNLILKGFRVKLTMLDVGRMRDNTTYYNIVPVKKFNEPLDINAAAYVLGDPRFYRFQCFKLIIHGCDINFKICDSSLGNTVRDKNLISSAIEKEYVPNSGLKQADTRLYFGGSRNMQEVEKEVTDALTILNANYGQN